MRFGQGDFRIYPFLSGGKSVTETGKCLFAYFRLITIYLVRVVFTPTTERLTAAAAGFIAFELQDDLGFELKRFVFDGIGRA